MRSSNPSFGDRSPFKISATSHGPAMLACQIDSMHVPRRKMDTKERRGEDEYVQKGKRPRSGAGEIYNSTRVNFVQKKRTLGQGLKGNLVSFSVGLRKWGVAVIVLAVMSRKAGKASTSKTQNCTKSARRISLDRHPNRSLPYSSYREGLVHFLKSLDRFTSQTAHELPRYFSSSVYRAGS